MKPLTNAEKALFAEIEEQMTFGGRRLTRPVVVIYYNGNIIGINTITAWRRLMKGISEPEKYVYELRRMWI